MDSWSEPGTMELPRSRVRSTVPKKKALSFLIGPPIEPPNCWRLKGGLTASAAFGKRLGLASASSLGALALSASSRKKPKTEPWNWLEPDLVTTERSAPPERPLAAEKRCVESANSCMPSIEKFWRMPPTALSLLSPPSTVMFRLRPVAPPTEKVPTRDFVGSNEGASVAPGMSTASEENERPLTGRFSSRRWSMTPDTSVFVVSTSGASSAVTLTTSVICPTFSVALTVVRWRTLTVTSLCTSLEKPCASTSTRYVPGTSCVISKTPSSLVLASREAFVATFTALTVAFETTSPFSFCTTPVMTPVLDVGARAADCGRMKVTASRAAARTEEPALLNLPLIIGKPPLKIRGVERVSRSSARVRPDAARGRARVARGAEGVFFTYSPGGPPLTGYGVWDSVLQSWPRAISDRLIEE